MLCMKNIIEYLRYHFLNNPNQLAIKDSYQSYTYRDLYLKVISHASVIKELGIINQPILVKVNRQASTLIAFFAILLSNNYYIPVDEDIVEEKLEKIISLSKCKYYISFKEDHLNIDKISFNSPSKIYDFDNFAIDFDENNHSYLMFTSGSTGEPKGVIKSQKNIISFIDNFLSTFPFLSQERIANQTPFFFDASAKDIYLSLALGASLFIPEKVTFSLPMETIKYLNDNQISYICWVPSILTMIARTKTLNYIKPLYLKYIYFVGEVFQPKYLNMWIEVLPKIRYFNIYGSTEIMGVALYYEIKGIFNKEVIPTGKPINNNQVELKDGEIVITSNQVAEGYINQLDNHTFVKKDNKVTLYTGDYASYDEVGNIIFASRKDYQIKHLGYRIELQEIEATLINIDFIDMCCAIYDDNNDKIVLFITLNKEIENPNKEIIRLAKEKLQFYMIPNKVIVLQEMPYNNNGKIDRVSLKKELQ